MAVCVSVITCHVRYEIDPESGCVRRCERSFMRPLLPASDA